MPFTLSSLIYRRAPSRSTTSTRNQRKLYFPPGGHTHDRHTIPPDRLHISLSDPVLVAAEEKLASAPNDRNRLAIIKEPRKTPSSGTVVLHLNSKILAQRSDDDNGRSLVVQAVNPLTMATSTQATISGHSWMSGFDGAAVQGQCALDPSDDSCDMAEVMTIVSVINGSPGNAYSRDGLDLAPLASETFKEELYIRGYLKRPASRPTNVVQRKPRDSFMFMSRKVFPKVLGRRQGRKIAECLRAEQDVAIAPGGPNALLSENHLSTVASMTPRTPHADDLESPRTDANTSASESFDLHEFSYITAFTTPPSSPSIILDAETSKKGVCLGDSKHAV